MACVGVCALMVAPAWAGMLNFSTGGINNTSWTITVSSGSASLSFENNEVDDCVPSPDAVLNDYVGLPTMALSGITPGSFDPDGAGPMPSINVITALLTPNNDPLTITANAASGGVSADTVVMRASVEPGGSLTVGTNFIAYSDPSDDLDIINYVNGYSAVIDSFDDGDAQGYDLDLSFSGDAASSVFDLLDTMQDGAAVSGSLSGQIVIPEPLTMFLLASGGAILLRRRT